MFGFVKSSTVEDKTDVVEENDVQQNLADILKAVSFVDKIIFGRLHYNKIVSEYDEYKVFYNDCTNQVIDFCHEHQIAYHIKNGTLTE